MATLRNSASLSVPLVGEDGKPELDKEQKPIVKVWRFGGMGPQVRANFARVLKERAWRELDIQRQYVDAPRFNRMESALTIAMTSGKYEWGDDVHQSIADSRAGTIATAIARLLVYHDEVSEKDVEAIVEAVGWERLVRVMAQADGPIPNGQPRVNPGAKDGPMPMTNEQLESSLKNSPERTPEQSSP